MERLANPGIVGSVRKIHGSVEKSNLAYDVDWVNDSRHSLIFFNFKNLTHT